MGCDGWAWSPGNISTRKKILASSPLFYGIPGVSLPPSPLWYACLNQRENSESTIYFFSVHVRLGLHRHKIFHLQCTNFCAWCYEYVVPKLSVMKFSNSRIIWYLPLLVCNWLFLRGMYLWQSWGSHTTKSALVCKELPTLSIPFVRKRRTANKLYYTIYLSSVFLILINTGVVALWNNWLRL